MRTVLAVILIVLSGSCARYFKPVVLNAPSSTDKGDVIKGNANNKFLILRHTSGSYAMENVTVDYNAQTLNCSLFPLPPEHTTYVGSKKNNYTYRKTEGAVLDEMHVFVNSPEKPGANKIESFPLSSIDKIEMITIDEKRTRTSYIVGTAVGAIAVGAAVAIIVSATSHDEPAPPPEPTGSSCPYIGVFDGEAYVVQGEMYGGAVFPQLERQDFMVMNAKPVNGEYALRISNELPEVQHTNAAKLLVVEHDKNVKIATDQCGNIFTLGNVEPIKNASLHNNDITAALQLKDNKACHFNDTSIDESTNTVYLHFNKPEDAREAKLLLRIKNNSWLDDVYDQFTKHFGTAYDRWIKKQQKVDAASLQKKEMDQNFHLNVSINTIGGWQEVTSLEMIGPLAYREVVVPVDLDNVKSNDIEIKLGTGFLFWDLDYAGIDFSSPADVAVQTLLPYSAVDENSLNVLPSIVDIDDVYLDQPKPGNETILKFKYEPSGSDKEATVILNSQGYYDKVKRYTGSPDVSFLKQFRKPGAFSAFSKQQYLLLQKDGKIAISN